MRRIVANTGLARSVISRNLAGTNEPSLATLMRFWEVYGVPIHKLIRQVDKTPPTSS